MFPKIEATPFGNVLGKFRVFWGPRRSFLVEKGLKPGSCQGWSHLSLVNVGDDNICRDFVLSFGKFWTEKG